MSKAENTYLRGSITVGLNCLFFGFNCIAYEHYFYLFGHIQNSQAGHQSCSETSPYRECSLQKVNKA